MKKCCDTCIYNDMSLEKCPCSLCNYEYDKWMGLTEWLNSFDTSSATKCFEAVNILKMKIAQEEMHEADERLLNSDWGEMEVQE